MDPLQVASQEDLANELMDRPVALNRGELATSAQCDTFYIWLSLRIDALAAERADEISYDLADRDREWVALADARLTQARAVRQALQQHRAELVRAERHRANVEKQAREWPAFKRLVRRELGDARYQALWDEARSEGQP